MPQDWFVLGISGITCGGKTTLVDGLKEKYPQLKNIRQDDYFLSEDDPRQIKLPSLDSVNWEIMSSLDMEKMRSDVASILNRPKISTQERFLVLDGFLVLNDEFLSNICTKKLFFTLPKDESERRRILRPPYKDLPQDKPGYFDKIVWPEYLKAKEEAFQLNPDIEFIDGSRDSKSILNEVVNGLPF
uniref:Phosphoribulokinase/uridine kinase domain-containing protein n=1 Tax=Clastoptera arizonana TaxID=38151 RepID=A0A1B6DYV3_9HEMI